MIKAGIFDVGGVLHDRSGPNIFEDVVKTLDLDREKIEKPWNGLLELLNLGQITEEEFWERFDEEVNITKPFPKESFFLREFIMKYGIHEDISELIKELRKNNYKTAILSNTIGPHVDYQRKIGIYDGFDVIILSNEVGLVKPNPDIYKLSLEKLDVLPEETFFVDDQGVNVKAANKLGIYGFLYEDVNKLLKDLRKIGVVFG